MVMADPFDPCCPGCGHRFALHDLARMARGDGWARFQMLRLDDGRIGSVEFDAIDPVGMQPIGPDAPLPPVLALVRAQKTILIDGVPGVDSP
jgi:hypothetical protein